MKSSIFILLIVFIALFSLDFIEAEVEPPNKYDSPEPAGRCKSAAITAIGTQNSSGSCSSQILGDLPPKSKMVSVIIVNPENGASIAADEKFKIRIEVSNLETGFFADPGTDFTDVSQTTTDDGIIKGHVHVTIQELNGNVIPNPSEFKFFKGMDDAADDKGGLETEVSGLPSGFYRLCTLAASEGHQPVVMPIVQRGSQDDCIRFSVTGDDGSSN
ncbi:3759_t:CDS:1, partial [Diversispora eburnea]